MAVKPTRSTNTTLTILRSSSTPGRASSVPQAVQKAMPAGSGPAPQDGQMIPSATPQPPQNAASRSFRTPHAGQCTLKPVPLTGFDPIRCENAAWIAGRTRFF